ncbi:hypothetical protein E4U31_002940 [Claviceps sp. LM219 group G6]|nr:hypothetical protein E4U31_002940 [Claviceps sp. LM219 group G6]
MTKFDYSKDNHQYDVIVSPDTGVKSALMRKIWQHESTKQALQKYVAIRGYLDRKVHSNTSVQVALNFINHLLRSSQDMVAIKRNFYPQDHERDTQVLMPGVTFRGRKGTYASIRMSHDHLQGGTGLALNADVSNTVFWMDHWWGCDGLIDLPIDLLLLSYLRECEQRWADLFDMVDILRPVRDQQGNWQASDAFKYLRRMKKIKFTIRHPNRVASNKVYTIVDFTFDAKYQFEGATANVVTFDSDHDGRKVTVADYYQQKYGVELKAPELPLIDAGRGGFIPMELAYIQPMQRYNFKLNPEKMESMIKFAVTRPEQRREYIEI